MKPRFMVGLTALAALGLVGCGGGGGTTAPFIPFIPAQLTGTIFVADNDNGIIAMSENLTSAALTLSATTPEGSGPTCLALNPTRTLLFCAEQGNGFIESLTLNGSVPTDSKTFNNNLFVRQMVVEPTGQFLYAQDDNGNIATLQITDAAGTLAQVGNAVATGLASNSTNGSLTTVTVGGHTFVVEADDNGINTFSIANDGTLVLADGSQANSGSSSGIATFVAGGTTFIIDPRAGSTLIALFSIDANGALNQGVSVVEPHLNVSAPVVCQTAALANTPQTAYICDNNNDLIAIPLSTTGTLQTPQVAATNLAFVDDDLIGDSTGVHLFAAQSAFTDLAVQSIVVNADGTVSVGSNVPTGGGDTEQLLAFP